MGACPSKHNSTGDHIAVRTCSCYMLALEPKEDCPVHGCPQDTCVYCGQFMPFSVPLEQFIREQTDLPREDAEVLYDNLYDLYEE